VLVGREMNDDHSVVENNNRNTRTWKNLQRSSSANEQSSSVEFCKTSLCPKYVLAPMVDQSELPFRMLCRKYGVTLCYTPMLHSKFFCREKKYRKKYWHTCAEDRPLVVQFCGNDPEDLLASAKMIERECDAIDINFGCPQSIAKRGNYGAFLMENFDLVYQLVNNLHRNLSIPIFCKIRIFNDIDKTLQLARIIEKAGCQLLTVHGRTKEMKGQFTGLADWNVIKRIKKSISIPVVSNGNVRDFNDVEACIRFTGADGVMSAEGLLRNPALFSGKKVDPFQLALEYLEFCEKYSVPQEFWAKTHICHILYDFLHNNEFARNLVLYSYGLKAMAEAVRQIEKMVKNGSLPKSDEPMLVIQRRKNCFRDIFDHLDGNELFSDY